MSKKSQDFDYFDDILGTFSSYKDQPRKLIIIATSTLEVLLNTLIAEKMKHGKTILNDSRDFSLSTKLILLSETDLITDSQFEAFNALRKIRNRAAHEPVFEITESDINTLYQHIEKTRKELSHILMIILGGVWNRYLDLFRSRFDKS